MRDWDELLPDLLHQICNFLIVYEDFISFGGVCTTWRKVAVEQNRGHPFLPLPCLMLAAKDDDKGDRRDFYSLLDKKVYSLPVIPDLKGKMCMETKGWLVTISDQGEMSLVNPFTREQISLPHLNTFKYYDYFLMDHLNFIFRAVLSSENPKSPDCVLMVIHGGGCHLGFCKPGDDQVWTVIEDRKGAFEAIEYYRGKFYAADSPGNVWECDVFQGLNNSRPVPMRIIGRIPLKLIELNQMYLVESTGNLLIVTRDGISWVDDETRDYGVSEFKVFEFDIEQGSLKEVHDLGSRSIFLGYSATLSIDTEAYPKLFCNSIYFTDDCHEAFPTDGEGKDMGIYNMSQKTISTHYPGKSLSRVCPPIWTFSASRELGRC